MSKFKWILKNVNTGAVFQLEKDPKGWEDFAIKLYRSEKYHGIFKQPSQTKLTFLANGGGMEFIEAAYRQEDINVNIELTCKHAGLSGVMQVLFAAKLNLASYEMNDRRLSTNIEQSSLYQKILSRDTISVDMESTQSIGQKIITAPAPTSLEMHSVIIYLSSQWVIDHRNTILLNPWFLYRYFDGISEPSTISGILGEDNFLDLKDCDESSAGKFVNNLGTPGPDFYLSDCEPYFTFFGSDFLNPTETFHFSFSMQGYLYFDIASDALFHHNGFAKFFVGYGPSMDTATWQVLWQQTWDENLDTSPFNTKQYPFDTGWGLDITLNVGDSIWVWWQYENSVSGGPWGSHAETIYPNFSVRYERREINLSLSSSYKNTFAKSVLVHEALNQVVDSIADSDGNLKSDYYGRTDSAKITYPTTGKGALKAVTNGINIRAFENKSIHCSLDELYKALTALDNIGLGIIDGKVRVEPLSFFFNKNKRIITLPNVASYAIKNDNTRYVNSIKIGYDRWETEFKGGLDEPCAKSEFSTLVDSVKGSVEYLSKYIASSYAIEATRRKFKARYATEDWRYDNDNFWIAVVKDGINYRSEKYSDAFSSGTGVTALTSAYNLRLTPKRMLLAHLNKITAGLQLIKGVIKFMKGEGNIDLSVIKTNIGSQEDYSGQQLAEKTDISWNDSNAANITPLWLPETYNFEYPITEEQFKIIDADPTGYVEFWSDPTAIKRGYILDMEYKLKDGLTTFNLLRKHGN